MTVTSQVNKVQYTATGSQTEFPTTYRFLSDSDLAVYVDGALKELTTDYTVSDAGEASGGTVTFLVAPDADSLVTIKNAPPFTQETDYVENDPFPAESHENALDKLTLEIQNVSEEVGRCWKFDVESTLESVEIENPSAENVGKSFEIVSVDSDTVTIGYTDQSVDDIPIAKVLVSDSDPDSAGYLSSKVRAGNAISISESANPPVDTAYKLNIQVETKPDGGIGIDSGGAGLEIDSLPSGILSFYKITSGEDPGHTHTSASLPPLQLVASNALDSSPGTLSEKLAVGNGIAKVSDDTEVTINVKIVTDRGLDFSAGGLQLTDEAFQAVEDSGKVLTNASDSTIKFLEDAVSGSNGINVETDGLLGSNFLVVKPSTELLRILGAYGFQRILNTVPPVYWLEFFDSVSDTNGVPSGWTFVSPGGGSYVDAAGDSQTAGVNELRHDWTAGGQYRGVKLVATEDTSLIYPTSNLLAFNDAEGSVYMEVDAETDPAFAISINNSADASNDRIRVFIDPEISTGKDRVTMEVKDGGVVQASINVDVDSTEIYRIAFGWKADEFTLCVNGVQESDFSGTVPSTFDRFVLAGSSSTVQGDQRISRFAYFARKLGPSTLCDLSSS